MFRDECEQQIVANIHTWERRMTQCIMETGEQPSPTDLILLQSEKLWLTSIRSAAHYWLSVNQARHFQSVAFEKRDIPHFPHSEIFVEFDGLLSFNYVLPVTHAHFDEDMNALVDKKNTSYRGVLLLKHNDEVFQAIWMEPPRYVANGRSFHDVYVISWSKESWPKRSCEVCGTSGRTDVDTLIEDNISTSAVNVALAEDSGHANRLLRMSVNLLYFLSAENQTFVRVRPEHVNRHGLPRSSKEFYITPAQSPHYRYLLGVNKGSGSKHSIKYDVRGHFRHLTDERFERNEDGTVRIIWIDEHQRGVENIEYKPHVRKGQVSRAVLEYDRFYQSIDDRLRRRRRSA